MALAVAFLVHFISAEMKSGRRNISIKSLSMIAIIGMLSATTYYIIQKLFLFFSSTHIGYVDTFFDINFLRENFSDVNRQVFSTLKRVYFGSPSIYGNKIRILVLIIILAFGSFAVRLIQGKLSIVSKIFVLFLSLLLLVLPFSSGYLMRGTIAMRFLVALPIIFAGLIMLGVDSRSQAIKLYAAFLVGFCIFQFVISINTLFAASHLALQADRVLAGRILERIAEAKATTGVEELKYMEVVGYIDRSPTRLIPKLETFGASFFEWDQGNTNRVLLFLRTLGYQELQALPIGERSKIMEPASKMPVWPDKGSVQMIDDTVVLKLGPYSYVQKRTICEAVKNPKYCD